MIDINIKFHNCKRTISQQNKAGVISSLLTGLVMVTFSSLALSAPAVCPQGSEGDRPFQIHNLKHCVWLFNDDYNNTPKRVGSIRYNIYCPGRMTHAHAEDAGRRMVNGSAIKEGSGIPKSPNIIIRQHRNARLKPLFSSIRHRFHYGCIVNGRNGVATHIKVSVLGRLPGVGYDGHANPTNPDRALAANAIDVSRSCRFMGSQNGGIALGARMDREYKCRKLMHKDELGGRIAVGIAYELMKRNDVLSQARRIGGKICVLNASALKIGPFDYASDTIVTRITTVRQTARCPAGTYKEIR